MGRGRADGQGADGKALLRRRDGAHDPELIKARRRLGVVERPLPLLGRIGIGPWNDWGKETHAQMWLRVFGPASDENVQKVADLLGMQVDELPPLLENTAASFYAGSTTRERAEAVARMRAQKSKWDAQGGKPAPWDSTQRLYAATLELADLVEAKAAEEGVSDLSRIEIEEKLAGLIGANPNRLEPLHYGRAWQALLDNAGFDSTLISALGNDEQAAASAEQLSQRICRADLSDNRIRLARYLMHSCALRDHERFLPIRDLFVNPESDSIHGWMRMTHIGRNADYQDLLSRKDGASDRAWLSAQLLMLRRDLRQSYTSDAERGLKWLTSPSDALGGAAPADLIREDPVAHWEQLESAAQSDPIEPYLS